ncbi:MAG: deoxyribodipyrimidine photolyase [Treponema sp.]|nr:MAG: deoxyribodipyrimidine photolyase [Treponema sp.]
MKKIIQDKKNSVCIFWFRRDLRLEDNFGLYEALNIGLPVLPLFIFDTDIICNLPENDARISFIYDSLVILNKALGKYNSVIYCKKGNVLEVWKNILNEFNVRAVYANEDYEPYAIMRDKSISDLLLTHNILFKLCKDQVIFAKNEVLKNDGTPYTVFTPYKNKWMSIFQTIALKEYNTIIKNDLNFFKYPFQVEYNFPSREEFGFLKSEIKVKDYKLDNLENYKGIRDFPALNGTSYLSVHLRFGTVSIRKIIKSIMHNEAFLSELIWREFFMQILFHFPSVAHASFKKKYDAIQWRNNREEFEKWKNGKTGYLLVDAGMRELNKTGYMHNRVRMVVASFLCKHLLIDWRWGEKYFAEKLLDFDLCANNGNWQWAAGTGCDAAPYFRVFNPSMQLKKFDSNFEYIKRWVPEFNTPSYPAPIVEHKVARERCLKTYSDGIAFSKVF